MDSTKLLTLSKKVLDVTSWPFVRCNVRICIPKKVLDVWSGFVSVQQFDVSKIKNVQKSLFLE